MAELEFTQTADGDTYKRWRAGAGTEGQPEYCIAMYSFKDMKPCKPYFHIYHWSRHLQYKPVDYTSFKNARKAVEVHRCGG